MSIETIGSWTSIIALGLAVIGFICKLIKMWNNLIKQQHDNETRIVEYLCALVNSTTSSSDRSDLSTFLLLLIEKYKRYNYQVLYESVVLSVICILFTFFALNPSTLDLFDISREQNIAIAIVAIVALCGYVNHFIFLWRVYHYRIEIENRILSAWEDQVVKKLGKKIDARKISDHKMPVW